MDHGVLAGEGDGVAHTREHEDFSVMVEAIECIVKLIESAGIDVGATSDVAEVEKGREALDNVVFHVVGNGRKINL